MKVFIKSRACGLALLGPALLLFGCTGTIPYSQQKNTDVSQALSPAARKEFFRAVVSGTSTEVLRLIKKGARINGETDSSSPRNQESNQVTPLMAAVIMDRLETARLLVLQGASLTPTYHGYTARDLAFLLGHHELVSLMERGVKKQ